MKINRRKFMKVFSGITAGLGALSKAEEPKEQIKLTAYGTEPDREYDLIADLVEEMNNFDKKLPKTKISYFIHCNYTGLAFLNDTGELEKYYDTAYGYSMRKGYTHTLWIPYKQWPRRAPKNLTFMMNVLVRPNLTADIGLIAQYSTRRNILNKLENVWTLVTTRCFNVNRDEEGKIIAGLEKQYIICKARQMGFVASCKEAIAAGQLVTKVGVDKMGVPWVKPIKDFYKNG